MGFQLILPNAQMQAFTILDTIESIASLFDDKRNAHCFPTLLMPNKPKLLPVARTVTFETGLASQHKNENQTKVHAAFSEMELIDLNFT